MVEELLAEDEGVGPSSDLLLRSPPEAPGFPVLKICLVITKKIKTHQPRAPQGEEPPPPQVVEHYMLCPYIQDELMDMGI